MAESKIGLISGGLRGNIQANVANQTYFLGKVITELNKVLSLLYSLDGTNRGGVLSNYDQRYTYQPSFITGTINPIAQGIDGTSIYTFSDSSSEGGVPLYRMKHPIFWKENPEDSSQHRPNTIYETFVSFKEWVESTISSSVAIVSNGDSCITNCSYTKGYIGTRAFTPGGAVEAGSMIDLLTKAVENLQQVRKDTVGSSYSYDNTSNQKSVYSLNDKVNALLALHGGNEYVEFSTGEESNIELTHDETSTSIRPKYVQFYGAENAEFLVENTPGVFEVSNRPSYDLPIDIDDLYDTPDSTVIFSEVPPHIPTVVVAGEPGSYTALNSCARWTVNFNSAYISAYNVDTDPVPLPIYNPERSQLRLDQVNLNLHINLIYDWSGSNSFDYHYFSSDTIRSYVEILLYGRPNASAANSVVARYKGSLEDFSTLSRMESSPTDIVPEVGLVHGPNKLCIFNGHLSDFTFLPGYEWHMFFANEDSGNTSHSIDYGVITVMHKIGTTALTDLNLDENEYYTERGEVFLIGTELEWFDFGSDASPGGGNISSVRIASLTDGTDTSYGSISPTSNIIEVTITDGSNSITDGIGN